MDNLLQISTALAAVRHHLLLTVINGRQRGQIAELIATMAIRESFSIVAGSEWLPLYDVARHLSYQTNDFKRIMDQVRLARAFTCYQLLDILNHTPPVREPLLVVNGLHPFYDADVQPDVRSRVLEACVRRLDDLSYARPIAVIVEHEEAVEYETYFPKLAAIADRILPLADLEEEPAVQLRMF
jgi:hypothetical protein